MHFPSKKDSTTSLGILAISYMVFTMYSIPYTCLFFLFAIMCAPILAEVLLGTTITVYLLFMPYWFVTVLILAWLVFDRKAPEQGACSVSRSSIDFLLTCKGTGNMLILLPGGVEECNYSMPYSCTIFLKNRYSFVNKALQHGAAIIPAFAFGETELYDKHVFPPGGLIDCFQNLIHRLAHFYPNVFYGRSFTENSWGFSPYAQPVTTVVGKPIFMLKIEQPSRKIVARYHTIYVDALKKLFNEHKTKYGISETQELVIN